jgi:hypothetical protein
LTIKKDLTIFSIEKSFVVAGSIEISNQLISDLLEFVEVAEEMINADVIRKHEISAN